MFCNTCLDAVSFKSLYKTVSEHKDILKMVSMLSMVISSSKFDAEKMFDAFKDFQELWAEVRKSYMNILHE